ncbi:TPA: hypothetical protein TXJ06_001399 [Streptococcus suis]|nr:hypothetical protein [Streptococcus suis]MCQ8265366.1 hypothetical protein [Streptococcus suis]HEL1584662.1 hypothetical protein [Streptococcus suis]HEL1639559.1 hypothetical protein [Streptococcus suis]
MKKVKKVFISAVLLSSIFLQGNILAATPKEIIESPSMASINPEQVVQVLPDGGFIFRDNGDSNFDPSLVETNHGTLMTYENYLKLETIDTSLDFMESPFLRSASPDKAVQYPKILAAGESYASQPFSGSGWRFSESKFKAASGTGTWLLWTAVGDGGVVGNEYEAYRTYQTKQSIGRAKLESGESRYVDGQGSWLFFYTYNPVKGSSYVVSNK